MATRPANVGAAVLLAALCCAGAALAADVDDLPPVVRMMLEGVEVDWEGLAVTAPEPVTLGPKQPAPLPGSTVSPTVAPGLAPLPHAAQQSPGAGSLRTRPMDLGASGPGQTAAPGAAPAAVPGPHLAGNAPVTLGAGDLLPDVVAASALSAARRDALVALAGTGALNAGEWKDTILREKLAFDDLCAIWQQFRRDYPQQGESPEHTRRLWHGARDALGLAEVDIGALATPQLFVLAEMQLYPGETEGAEKCLRALLARLESGEPPGPRVTKGLLAYRIAQCYKHRGVTGNAVEWFLSCAEWGAPTKENSYDVRGEGLVEAARLLRQVGRTEEAEATYRKAIASTAGWGKAVAMLDLSGLLCEAANTAEVDALLAEVATGRYGPVVQAHAYLATAQRRLEARDGQGARAWLGRVLELAAGPSDRSTAAGLAAVARSSERILEELARWESEPIRASPRALVLSASGGSVELVARSWSATLSASATVGWLAVQPMGAPERRDGVTRYRYRVSVGGKLPGHPAADIIVSTDTGQAPLRVPVAVEDAPAVGLTPQECFFGFVSAGEQPRQGVTVSLPPPFVVEAARSDARGIAVASPARAGDGWRIAVLLTAPDPGVVDGTVTILTDMPGAREIRVPVYAHVLPGQG